MKNKKNDARVYTRMLVPIFKIYFICAPCNQDDDIKSTRKLIRRVCLASQWTGF